MPYLDLILKSIHRAGRRLFVLKAHLVKVGGRGGSRSKVSCSRLGKNFSANGSDSKAKRPATEMPGQEEARQLQEKQRQEAYPIASEGLKVF